MKKQKAKPFLPTAASNRDDTSTATVEFSETMAEWSGPLPPPEVLQQFGSVVTGGAERIFKMTEVEAIHRIEMEDRGQKAAIRDTARSHWLAAFVCALALCLSTSVALFGGHWAVSVALVGVPVFTAIVAFIQSNRK